MSLSALFKSSYKPDNLPLSTRGEVIPNQLRATPEDFLVDELAAYPPSGNGDHLFIRFEKKNLGTPDAIRRIAKALDCDPKQAGWAGLKDRVAITRQWASFLCSDPTPLENADLGGIQILEYAAHPHKLRTGHLKGNRFTLVLRGPTEDHLPLMQSRLNQLQDVGMPNYFGVQRFGRDADNLLAAAQWLIDKGRPPRARFKRKLLMSVFQSALFNALLAERVSENAFAAIRVGDVCKKEDSGGIFVAESLEDVEERAKAFEISATGPIFGPKMRWPEGDPQAREEAILSQWGLSRGDLAPLRKYGPGTRRPYRTPVIEPSLRAVSDGIELAFTLRPGSYATVLVRELTGL